MRDRVRWTIAGVAILLTIIGLLLSSDGREETQTTFGVSRHGYKALHDLLVEIGMPTRRSYLGPSDLPADATVWWLNALQSPFEVNSSPCSNPADDDKKEADDDKKEKEEDEWAGAAWLAAGGTAVVFPAPAWSNALCPSVAGFKLPARLRIDEHGDIIESTKKGPRRRTRAAAPFEVRGPEQDRLLRADAFLAFDGHLDWMPVAWIEDRPFVIERTVGRGRLVVVADARFLQNVWLATGDAAPYALDLARRYGVPLLDENAHGFRPSQDVFAYLLKSPAIGVLGGLCLLGALIVWRGSLVPGRPLETSEPPAPALDTYVDSLAGWYARTSDYHRVVERYRQYALARLRRLLHLPPETPLQALAERLESKARFTESMRSTLLQPPAASNRDELFAIAGKLDALIRACDPPRKHAS